MEIRMMKLIVNTITTAAESWKGSVLIIAFMFIAPPSFR